MQVPHQQPFHPRIGVVGPDRLRQLHGPPIVQHLVRLDVDAPGMRAGPHRPQRLVAEHRVAPGHVPLGLEDADLRVGDRPDEIEGLVLRATDVDDDLVADRQDGADAGHDRKVQLDRVPDDGEAGDAGHADSHGGHGGRPTISPARYRLSSAGEPDHLAVERQRPLHGPLERERLACGAAWRRRRAGSPAAGRPAHGRSPRPRRPDRAAEPAVHPTRGESGRGCRPRPTRSPAYPAPSPPGGIGRGLRCGRAAARAPAARRAVARRE